MNLNIMYIDIFTHVLTYYLHWINIRCKDVRVSQHVHSYIYIFLYLHTFTKNTKLILKNLRYYVYEYIVRVYKSECMYRKYKQADTLDSLSPSKVSKILFHVWKTTVMLCEIFRYDVLVDVKRCSGRSPPGHASSRRILAAFCPFR